MVADKKKYSRLITDIGLFALGALGSKLILFLLVPLYTNVLSDSEYGIADLVFTASDLVLPIVSLAIYNGLLRFGLVPEKHEKSIKCTWIVFVLGVLTTIMITPLASIYRPIAAYKWLLAFKIIATFSNSNSMIGLKIKGKNKAYAILSILQAILLISFNLLFLIHYRLGIIGYLWSTILSLFLTSIIAFIYSGAINDVLHAKVDGLLMKEMVFFSLPFIINDVSWWLVHSSDKFMIEWMIGSSLLGIYTAATKIPSLINSVTAIFSQAWGIASIKEFDTTNDTTFYSRVFKYYFISIYGVCVVIVSITKPFMSVYLGKEFADAWHFVPLLLVSAAFAAISTFSGSLFSALKKSKDLMITTIVSASANVVVNYLMIPICGVWGAVIGTVVAYIIVALSRMISVSRYLQFDYSLKLFVPLSILLLVEALLIGIDFYVLPTACVCLLLFGLMIRKDIKPLLQFAKTALGNRAIRKKCDRK